MRSVNKFNFNQFFFKIKSPFTFQTGSYLERHGPPNRISFVGTVLPHWKLFGGTLPPNSSSESKHICQIFFLCLKAALNGISHLKNGSAQKMILCVRIQITNPNYVAFLFLRKIKQIPSQSKDMGRSCWTRAVKFTPNSLLLRHKDLLPCILR